MKSKRKALAQFVSRQAVPSSQEAIDNLSEAIIESDLELVEPDTDHQFHGGMYARTIYIPAGVVLTGREHYSDHFNFLSQGRVLVTINGESKEIAAPAILKADANSSKAFMALEDTMWTTVHICKAEGIEAAEEELMAPVPEHIAEANKRAHKLIKYDITPVLSAGERKCLRS